MQERSDAIAEFMRRSEAAEYISDRYRIPCSFKTLTNLAWKGGGPQFRRAGRITLYTREDLDAWALARMSRPVTSTTEFGKVGRAA